MERKLFGENGKKRVSVSVSLLAFSNDSRCIRVQIQILLYLFKLSLPGPQPAPTAESNNTMSKKRKRPAIYDPPEPILTADDHLETFMDKLAIWQLVERVDGALNKTNTGLDKKRKNLDDRHWTQIFAEDIVEPQ